LRRPDPCRSRLWRILVSSLSGCTS
jgi:hypothetical protein